MELWVRSQDRMLLSRTVDIRIVIEQEGTSIIDDTTSYILGMYKSEKRALEVLDEIQKTLEICQQSINEKELHFTNNDDCTFNISVGTQQTLIYEMPKE